ncbi:MAG: flagellar basal body P-ring formation protein FlgA [Gammaproteobacteria bacterium]|nr:flagellar basal body P-ring formation protein FlgA [Gammaproteobacteria bacterium]
MKNIAKSAKSRGDRGHALVVWLLLLWPLAAQAGLQSQLQAAISDFVEASMPALEADHQRDITLGAAAAHLNHAPCPEPLAVSLPGSARLGRNTTVKVSCGTNWNAYIPLQVRERQPVVVATRALTAGTVLTADMLTIAMAEPLATPGSSATRIEPLLGARVKRAVQPGRPLRSNNLCAVCTGDEVEVLAMVGEMTVKTTAIAEADAAIGEQIRIRNNRSGKTFHGRVQQVGLVIVKL